MNSNRFDELTKGLANGATSRRKFLTGLAGAAAGTLLAAPRARAVVAPGGGTCSNQGQSCTAQQCCQGLNCLTDFTNSTEKFCCSPGTPLVCGSKCCPTGAVLGCSAGKCTCPTGEVVCPDANNPLAGRCVNLAEDTNNCGACGVTCADPTGADAPCRVAACVNGGCTTVAKPGSNGTPCEDGDLCTLNDTCNNGTCQRGTQKQCPQCQKCDPSTGACVSDTSKNGQTCNDGNACTTGETCQNGLCTGGTPINCDDNNECTQDTCDPAMGCVHTPLTGTPCETGNKCTADTCDNGVCKQGPQSVTCGQCQVCDPTMGTCKNVENGTACTDGDVCTVGDVCQNGTCVSGPVKTCGQCQKCANVGGVATCVADTSKNGQTCNDGNACTTGETCQNGVCTGGTPKNCNDLNVCTGDSCDPATGNCVHTPLTGNPCGMVGSGRTCCAGMCCQSTEVCCSTGANAGKCGRTTGSNCANNQQCCSGNCTIGPGGGKCV